MKRQGGPWRGIPVILLLFAIALDRPSLPSAFMIARPDPGVNPLHRLIGR